MELTQPYGCEFEMKV